MGGIIHIGNIITASQIIEAMGERRCRETKATMGRGEGDEMKGGGGGRLDDSWGESFGYVDAWCIAADDERARSLDISIACWKRGKKNENGDENCEREKEEQKIG